jgi:hypothetical protein
MKKYPLLFILVLTLSFQLLYSFTYAQTKTDSLRLKAFAGKYQLESNKMSLLQILQKGNQLALKQLWDGEEIVFKQTSELEFYNDERSFPLTFIKNNNGEVIRLLAANKDVWNRVADNYIPTPELQKTIQLTAEQLKAFEGKYKLDGGDANSVLQITAANGHLVIKYGQSEVSFSPVSATDFFNEDQTIPLKFSKGADGSVTQLFVKNGNDDSLWIKIK